MDVLLSDNITHEKVNPNELRYALRTFRENELATLVQLLPDASCAELLTIIERFPVLEDRAWEYLNIKGSELDFRYLAKFVPRWRQRINVLLKERFTTSVACNS